MPKLYEYFGLIVMFYANEQKPVYVHGKCQGRESRAEIIFINGEIQEIRYTRTEGRAALECNEMRFFQEIVSAKANEIITRWIEFFVLHKTITAERIDRRLKCMKQLSISFQQRNPVSTAYDWFLAMKLRRKSISKNFCCMPYTLIYEPIWNRAVLQDSGLKMAI
jgi:hypothetical protein